MIIIDWKPTRGNVANQLRHAAAMRRRRKGDPEFNRRVAAGAVRVARLWREQIQASNRSRLP